MIASKKGFTLIELIIVVIIIGILAAIAVPMMSTMKVRGVCAEAVTAMGTIRTAMRAYIAEYGQCPPDLVWEWFYEGWNMETKLGLKYADFEGRYFRPHCYAVERTSDTSYSIYAYPDPLSAGCAFPNDAPGNATGEVSNMPDDPQGYLQMDKDGNITQCNFSKSGYYI